MLQKHSPQGAIDPDNTRLEFVACRTVPLESSTLDGLNRPGVFGVLFGWESEVGARETGVSPDLREFGARLSS